MTSLSFKILKLKRHFESLSQLSEKIRQMLPQNEIPIRWSIVAVETDQWILEVGIKSLNAAEAKEKRELLKEL